MAAYTTSTENHCSKESSTLPYGKCQATPTAWMDMPMYLHRPARLRAQLNMMTSLKPQRTNVPPDSFHNDSDVRCAYFSIQDQTELLSRQDQKIRETTTASRKLLVLKSTSHDLPTNRLCACESPNERSGT